ncbi:MAG: CorA family divalent cation transporter [Xanthobacteraceae bacterium]
MLQIYSADRSKLKPLSGPYDSAALAAAYWVDVYDPTPEEQRAVEQALDIRLQVPEEPETFQVSTPLRSSDGQTTLTALLLTGLDAHDPALVTVAFIRSKGPLVTVTKGGPGGLRWLLEQCDDYVPPGSADAFPVLLDLVIEHATDVLDHVAGELDRLNRTLFQHHTTPRQRRRAEGSPRRRNLQLERILTGLGYWREVLVKLRRSVLSFRRVVALLRERDGKGGLADKLASFERELASLELAEEDLSATTSFMLDGAVGFIGILQSRSINIMTIVGVVLTPPVLVASIYGMNFKAMPELQWAWGYPWALLLMALSGVGMFLLVRARGWL